MDAPGEGCWKSGCPCCNVPCHPPAGGATRTPAAHLAHPTPTHPAPTPHPPLPPPGYTPYDFIDFTDIPLKHELVTKVDRPVRWGGTSGASRGTAVHRGGCSCGAPRAIPRAVDFSYIQHKREGWPPCPARLQRGVRTVGRPPQLARLVWHDRGGERGARAGGCMHEAGQRWPLPSVAQRAPLRSRTAVPRRPASHLVLLTRTPDVPPTPPATQIGFREGDDDLCALNMWYRWGEQGPGPRRAGSVRKGLVFAPASKQRALSMARASLHKRHVSRHAGPAAAT